MIKWDGQAYSAMIVASSPLVFQRIGATNEDLDERDSKDVRNDKLFKGFRDAASLLIVSMKSHLKQEQNTVNEQYLLSGAMQQYVANQDLICQICCINLMHIATPLSAQIAEWQCA